MDDHHQQPIWPMVQGAVDYALNLAGEVWAMIYRQPEEPRAQPVREMSEMNAQTQEEVVQVIVDCDVTNIQDAVKVPKGLKENERGD